MATANPVYGRFDPYKSINEQIKVYPPTLSRFDLVIALEDKPDEIKDHEVGLAIAKRFRPSNDNDTTQKEIDDELLHKYLTYARTNYKPIGNEELDEYLATYYVKIHKNGEDPRANESVNRFAGAIAKLRLHEVITEEDYEEAIKIKEFSYKTLGIDLENVDIDNVRGHTDNKDRERRKQILKVMEWYINTVENLEAEAIPKDILLEQCKQQHGMGKSKFYDAFAQLKNGDEIYEYNKKVYFKKQD